MFAESRSYLCECCMSRATTLIHFLCVHTDGNELKNMFARFPDVDFSLFPFNYDMLVPGKLYELNKF